MLNNKILSNRKSGTKEPGKTLINLSRSKSMKIWKTGPGIIEFLKKLLPATIHFAGNLRNWTKGFTLTSEDAGYKQNFDRITGPELYRSHLEDYFICCAFCAHLSKSTCHEFCFSCSKNTYQECSCLLPGTFSFTGSHFDLYEQEVIPWIFKTPCTGFERLEPVKYLQNFNSFSQSVTVANYEALEGIFLGISRGKRPCHICASVNIEIFNRCSNNEKTSEKNPCSIIILEIAAKYRTTSGVIKYIE